MVNRNSQFKGGNTEQMRSLAMKFDNSANDIERLTNELTSTLSNTEWSGTDAQSFDSDWNGTQVGNLRRVVQALRDGSNKLKQNAQAQDTVSAQV